MRMKFAETAFHTPPETAGFCIKNLVASWLLSALVVGCSVLARAQEPSKGETPAPSSQADAWSKEHSPGPVDIKSLPKNLFLDQKQFWTAPFHMSEKQWEWALPSVLVGGIFIEADQTIENHVPTNKSTVSHAVTVSNAGVAALTAAGAGLFLLGHIQNNDQKRETGILAGEAAIGALVDTEVFKYAAGRERPFTGTSPGRFFVGGDSFPSVHSSVGWAIASAINLPNAVKGNKFLGGATNGWVLSGITQWQSGPPLQPNTAGTLNVSWPTNMQAPDYLGTNAPSATSPLLTCDPRKGLSSGQFFNPNCFTAPVGGKNGNIIWPYIKGPAFFNSDLETVR